MTLKDLVFSPTYAHIYIIKILSQAVTLVALFTPTLLLLLQSTARHGTLHTHNIDMLPHRRTYKSLNS